MYPVLILRAEAVCLVILIFLYYTSRDYQVDRGPKTFGRLWTFAFIHVCFDIITVFTVNNTQSVPSAVNYIYHVIFYLSAILYSNELANYVIRQCHPKNAKKFYILGLAVAGVYLCCLPLLKIEYVPDVGTYSSAGSAAIVGYSIAFVFFITALIMIFVNWSKMSRSIRRALIPLMLLLMVVEVGQAIFKSLLFTGCAITIVTVGFFFSLENPVQVFKNKAMVDALTGVHSRASYEADISKLDKKFREKPDDSYTFVFCDLNDLHNVNAQYGHAVGDEYITFVASSINRCMSKAFSVYRIGGDEFLVIYYDVPESTVIKEIENFNKSCAEESKKHAYIVSVATGYARSSENFKSLCDVVKTADYEMYLHKTAMKAQKGNGYGTVGTRLNYSGLMDKVFDAMCSSNDKHYPYITNLETNVTRISPEWKEFFGLEDEFYTDFNSVWEKRIHPDYLEGFKADIAAVMNGHKKYHNYDYYAQKADGEYVHVSCHGSKYNDAGEDVSYFCGFIENHGVKDTIDENTGLRNYDQLTARVCLLMDNLKPFSVLKVRVNNFARVNMLYGYDGGLQFIRSIKDCLCSELGERGEVFTQEMNYFSILLDTDDITVVEDYYETVSKKLTEGVAANGLSIPVQIAGGAIINHGEPLSIQTMRRNLVYVLEESMNSNRNRLVVYGGDFDRSKTSTLSILSEIHSDVITGKEYFKLRYQPVVSTVDERIIGAEALLYWRHPAYGEIPPGQFIAFLETDPCYYQLGISVIRRAVQDAKRMKELIPTFRINVNITSFQLQNDSFPDDVCGILNEFDYPARDIILELTERCKELDSAYLDKRIKNLRNRGIRVAFDDLGTGYSTINLLMNIPVDEVKLDRDFVRDLPNRSTYQLYAQALVQGASSVDREYSICFEGVENEETFNFIRKYGDFLAQGYYFTKPLLIDAFSEYVTKRLN